MDTSYRGIINSTFGKIEKESNSAVNDSTTESVIKEDNICSEKRSMINSRMFDNNARASHEKKFSVCTLERNPGIKPSHLHYRFINLWKKMYKFNNPILKLYADGIVLSSVPFKIMHNNKIYYSWRYRDAPRNWGHGKYEPTEFPGEKNIVIKGTAYIVDTDLVCNMKPNPMKNIITEEEYSYIRLGGALLRYPFFKEKPNISIDEVKKMLKYSVKNNKLTKYAICTEAIEDDKGEINYFLIVYFKVDHRVCVTKRTFDIGQNRPFCCPVFGKNYNKLIFAYMQLVDSNCTISEVDDCTVHTDVKSSITKPIASVNKASQGSIVKKVKQPILIIDKNRTNDNVKKMKMHDENSSPIAVPRKNEQELEKTTKDKDLMHKIERLFSKMLIDGKKYTKCRKRRVEKYISIGENSADEKEIEDIDKYENGSISRLVFETFSLAGATPSIC